MKQINKQNTTRNIEIKNKMIVTRGERDNGRMKGKGPSRNMYKGHMDKVKGGKD